MGGMVLRGSLLVSMAVALYLDLIARWIGYTSSQQEQEAFEQYVYKIKRERETDP